MLYDFCLMLYALGMKKYVLGMAKSNLDLKGGKSRSLELDYLRLAYAVTRKWRKGWNAVGYLFVATDVIKKLTDKWNKKYNVRDHVKVVAGLTKREISLLRTEKRKNALGNRDNKNAELSIARVGDSIGRKKLREVIEKDNPCVHELTKIQEKLLPMQIRWDYYGEIK